MNDHESFLLLAAKQIGEDLSASEEAELGAHLATCPSCRSLVAAMRRDDILLRGQLGPTAVAPRVRRRVLEEASGRRRFDGRVVLALAATLLLAGLGVQFIAGGRPTALPSSSLVANAASGPPSGSGVPTDGSVSQPPSPSPGSGPFVAGAFTYGDPVARRDAIAAQSKGGPVGEWSRTIPATGPGASFGGPVTCLVISGKDAWLAGPATTVTDGSTNRSAFVHVHDGGPAGHGDSAILWLNNPGQTLTTLEGWCESRFIPGGPFPLTSGDVVVQDGAG